MRCRRQPTRTSTGDGRAPAGCRRLRRVAAGLITSVALVAAAAAVPAPPDVVSVSTEGAAASHASLEASVSGNGRYVVYRSLAPNLAPDIPDAGDRIFLRDRAAGTTTLLSAVEGVPFGGSYNPHISANGRTILFQTYAAVLEEDAGGHSDFVLVDRKRGTKRLVSRNAAGVLGNSSTFMAGNALSANGRFAAAYSAGTNLTDSGFGGGHDLIYFFDFARGTVALVSAAPDGTPALANCGQPSLSANGRWLAFQSRASNLVEGVGNGFDQIFVYDTRKRTLRLVSHDAERVPANAHCAGAVVANNGVVAFRSEATNLVGASDPSPDGDADLYLFDPRKGGSMRRLSQAADGTSPAGDAGKCAINQTGTLVVFATFQALVDDDDNGRRDLYAVDVKTGAVRLLTRDADGGAANDHSDLYAHSLSSNGRWLAFSSAATDIAGGEANGTVADVFVLDTRP